MANYIVHKNNNITLVKGDTFEFNLFIEDDDLLTEPEVETYKLQDDDILYFNVYPYNDNYKPVISKTYDANSPECITDPTTGVNYIKIILNRIDTVNLPSDIYYYDVKLHRLKETSEEQIDK